jgi:hypothetical protein
MFATIAAALALRSALRISLFGMRFVQPGVGLRFPGRLSVFMAGARTAGPSRIWMFLRHDVACLLIEPTLQLVGDARVGSDSVRKPLMSSIWPSGHFAATNHSPFSVQLDLHDGNRNHGCLRF